MKIFHNIIFLLLILCVSFLESDATTGLNYHSPPPVRSIRCVEALLEDTCNMRIPFDLVHSLQVVEHCTKFDRASMEKSFPELFKLYVHLQLSFERGNFRRKDDGNPYFLLDFLWLAADWICTSFKGDKAIDLKSGFMGSHTVGGGLYTFCVKGGWKLVNFGLEMQVCPNVFLSFIEAKNCPAYWHQIDWLNSKDQSKPRVMICTPKGPIEENVLWVQKSTDCYAIKLVSGAKSDAPFSILSETTVPLCGSLLNDLKLNDGDNYFPLPETDADLDVLELLLEQYKQQEEKLANLQPKVVEEVSSDEEGDAVVQEDAETPAVAEETVVLSKAQERKIKRDARRALRRQEQERLAEAKKEERKQHILDLENESIQRRAKEIMAQQEREERIRQEQEAIVGRFDQGQRAINPHSKRGAGSAAASATPKKGKTHQNDERWQSAVDQAKSELQGRRAKMNQVAKVLNQVFKIFPDMRNKLLPSSAERQKLAARQRGSHSVLPGAAATAEDDALAPTTFVIPHGRSDLTIPAQRALSFVEAFTSFCAANSKSAGDEDV